MPLPILDLVARQPRAILQHQPTPIEPLARVSEALGVNVFIKRDDLTSLGFGGNKIRQLEFYFGAAQAAGADVVLITGAVQSNFVRSTAAVAAKLGLEAVLQLEERVADVSDAHRVSGNVLLDDLLGARRISYPEGEDEDGADRALRTEADRLRSAGRTPYVIPLSAGNPPRGSLGYILAANEIVEQSRQSSQTFDAVFVASGSGQTHSGLLFGLRGLGVTTPVYGACVRREAGIQNARIENVCRDIAALLDCEPIIKPEDVITSDQAFPPSYGKIGPLTREAIQMLARLEGLFVDPVYTGKVLGELIARTRDGTIAQGANVLFVHTGGLPALFAYEPEIRKALA